jgi:TPR repeat protein
MKILLAVLSVVIVSCTSGEQTLLFECEQQNAGEACNKLGKARQGEEALRFFRRGCELENSNSCVSLAEKIKDSDRPEALRVLKLSCDWGNARACANFSELVSTKPAD